MDRIRPPLQEAIGVDAVEEYSKMLLTEAGCAVHSCNMDVSNSSVIYASVPQCPQHVAIAVASYFA